jgi:hypothetical protein
VGRKWIFAKFLSVPVMVRLSHQYRFCVRVQFILTWFGKLGKRLIVYTLQVVKTIPSFHSAQSNSTQPRANRNADRTSTGQSVVRERTPHA